MDKIRIKNSLIYMQFLVFAIIVSSCNQNSKDKLSWQTEFNQKLPLLGHRNWVLVVDKAFPLQSAAGITIINTGEQLPVVLKEVMKSISTSTHVKPIVYTDSELSYITQDISPGADEMKKEIFAALKGFEVNTILHEAVFAKLDDASKLFGVVVLKTESTVPYSSVFIQLDCAYWDANREKSLRIKMAKASSKVN
jgi:D-ribose pyranose/furanose isomerase RbsD